jgi:hypothetical protein
MTGSGVLDSFIAGRHGTSATTIATLAGGLAGLLISARKNGFVHADLHAGNIGIQKQGNVVETAPKRRLNKKSPDDSTQKQTALVRFADYSRSYTLDTATGAREELARDLHVTPAQACLVGSCGDICTLMISLCNAALRADASLKHDLLSVMVGQLIDKTALAEHLKEAASHCRGKLKTAVLACVAMFEGEDWKRLLLEKHFETHWRDRRHVLEELYEETYAIPACIYKHGSPALRGFEFPSWSIT